MKAESYEAVTRVGGSFAQFRRGMDLLVGRNIPFIVTGALLPPNRSEIEEFESWALSIPWMRRPPPYSMCFDLRKRRDNPEKNRLIESLRVSPDDILAMLKRRPESERRLWMEFCRNHMKLPGDRLFRCSGNRAGCVDAYGRFQACMLLCDREYSCDLRRISLRNALEMLHSRMQETVAVNSEYLKRCARCFIHPLCEQCPAKSWIESGSLDTPVEYLCMAAHAHARVLGLIRPEEKAWSVSDWEKRIEQLAFQTVH